MPPGRPTKTRNQPEHAPWPPYENPEPAIAGGITRGQRLTCGHPRCWDLEQRHQLERSPAYQHAEGNYFGPKNEPAPKLEKRKGLQPVGATA